MIGIDLDFALATAASSQAVSDSQWAIWVIGAALIAFAVLAARWSK